MYSYSGIFFSEIKAPLAPTLDFLYIRHVEWPLFWSDALLFVHSPNFVHITIRLIPKSSSSFRNPFKLLFSLNLHIWQGATDAAPLCTSWLIVGTIWPCCCWTTVVYIASRCCWPICVFVYNTNNIMYLYFNGHRTTERQTTTTDYFRWFRVCAGVGGGGGGGAGIVYIEVSVITEAVYSLAGEVASEYANITSKSTRCAIITCIGLVSHLFI